MENNENEFQQGSVPNEQDGYTQAPNDYSMNGQGQPTGNPYGQQGQPAGNPYGQGQPVGNPYGQGQPMGSPYGQVPQEQGGQGLAIAGMVLGIISLVCCCTGYIALVLGIVGFILSLVSLIQKKPGKGMAIAGIICSAISVVMLVILLAIGNSISADEMQQILRELETNMQ
jgi:hypothetical protein